MKTIDKIKIAVESLNERLATDYYSVIIQHGNTIQTNITKSYSNPVTDVNTISIFGKDGEDLKWTITLTKVLESFDKTLNDFGNTITIK